MVENITNTEEQLLLDKWMDQYTPGQKKDCWFMGYRELIITDGWRMGYIRCSWNRSTGKVHGEIWLDDDHAKCPRYFRDAVLWHEFCHWWDCVRNLHVDHCSTMQRLKWRKPGYYLADVFLKIFGWIWFD